MTFGNYIYPDDTSKSRQEAINQLINTSDALEAGHLKAVESASSLQTTIANLDMNDAEDGFKQALVDDINKTISDNIEFGNMYYALDDIVKKGGEIMSNPAVIGRLKAQQDYKAFHNELDKRNDITEDEKEWLRELNPYHYEDKVDSNGRIIGGTKWNPNKNINGDIDYTGILIKAINNIAHKDIKAGQSVIFRDKDLKPIDPKTNPGGIVDAVIVDSYGNEIEWLSKDKIKGALHAAIAGTPGAQEGLKNKYQFSIWYHDKHKNDEGYADNMEITDGHGAILDYDDFVSNMFNQGIDAAKYEYRRNTRDTKFAPGHGSGAGSSGGATTYVNPTVNITALGVPTQQTLMLDQEQKENMTSCVNIAKNLGSTILGKDYKFDDKQPDLSFNNTIEGIKSKIAMGQMDPEKGEEAINAITRAHEDYNLNKANNEALKRSYIIGLDGKEAEEFDRNYDFVTNLENGTLTDQNKTYAAYCDIFNEIFKDGNGGTVDKREYTFDPAYGKKLKQWCDDNDIDLSNYGVTLSGGTLVLPKNIQAATIVGRMLNENELPNITRAGKKYNTYNKTTNPAKPGSAGTQSYTKTGEWDTANEVRDLGKYVNKISDDVNSKINDRLSKGVTTVSQSYLLPNNDWTNVQEGIDVTNAKVIYDDVMNRIKNLAPDLREYKVYGFAEKDKDRLGNLVPMQDGTTRRMLDDDFNHAKSNGKLQISPMIHNHEGIGAYLTFPIYKDGKETGKYNTIFVADLHKSAASEEWQNSPDVYGHMQVGQINEVPGQSRYAVRSSQFKNTGDITITSLKDFNNHKQVGVNFAGRQFTVGEPEARQLMSFGRQLEMFAAAKKKKGNSDETFNKNLDAALQKIGQFIGGVSGVDATQVYNSLLMDFNNL